ncbi:Mitochondrial outer membrane protein iml2 [Xanthoria parietina]
MLRGWLRDKKGELNASTHSLDALAEPQDIEASMRAANYIMNDDLQAAEDGLANGTSSFHKMGKGMVAFLRATLGFEPEIMREASERLADAETTASADHRKAQRDPHVHRSAIYPVGSEFALCNAQAQLMGAVVGVLNESLTESIRGFYKLRKAFVTLDAILAAEDKYVRGHSAQTVSARHSLDSLRSTRSTRSTKAVPGGFGDDRAGGKKQEKPLLDVVRQNEAQAAAKSTTNSNGLPMPEDDDDNDDEFYDVDESHEDTPKTDTYAGIIEIDGVIKDLAKNSLDDDSTSNTQDLPPLKSLSSDHQILDHDPDSDVFSNPIDVFIHSGANLCFGLLLLMISMIPPAFNRLLFIIGFHGDRDRGLRLLWQASKFHNVNGAMAGLVLLGYYHQVVGFADVLPEPSIIRTSDNEAQQDVQGYPKERCEALLQDMRTRHPKSHLWLLEQARLEAMNRRLSTAISLFESSPTTKSPLKQVEALNMFEKSLSAMYIHNYALCSESFLNCVKLNNWSHALYYYIAGVAHVESYRHCKISGASAKESKKHAEKATEYLHQAPKHAGKKKFMARQLPFDVFVVRKIQKWDARAKEWNVPFIDAIGVSPLEEMIFFWNGYRRMDESQLHTSLDNLKWSDDPSRGNKTLWAKEEADEKAVLAVLRAVTLRNLQRWDEAATILQENVLAIPNSELKGGLKDDWTAPCARYEMGVAAWLRRKEGPGAKKEEVEWVRECEGWVEKAAKWESYELDARVGLKVATAQDTLKKYWEGRKRL